jgi:hypothetical protein
MIRQDQIFIRHVQTCSDLFLDLKNIYGFSKYILDFLNIFWDFLNIVLLTDAVLKRHGGLEKTGQS